MDQIEVLRHERASAREKAEKYVAVFHDFLEIAQKPE